MLRVLVDGGIFLDQRIHVRHGDEDLCLSLRHRFGKGELVQVLRVVIVDGSPEQISQVTSLRGKAHICRGLNLGKLGDGLRGKFGEQSSRKHDSPGDVLQGDAVLGVSGFRI